MSDDNKYEVRVHSYGQLACQNPSLAGGLYGSAQAQGISSATAMQMQQSWANQQAMNQQAINQAYYGAFTGNRTFTLNGQSHTVSNDDYEFILKAGFEALKKREDYKEDFENLLK